MKKEDRSKHIFTPQGRLDEVERTPNIDFLMNVFNIPRAFGVSGFGQGWSVGQHQYAVALLAVMWAKHRRFSEVKRNALVVEALLHDAHEAVTGDILPMLKSDETRRVLDRIQNNILKSMGISTDPTLETDLKIVDMIGFIYEIQQVSPSIMHPKKLKLAHTIAREQRDLVLAYATKHGVSKQVVTGFLRKLEL